MFPSEKIYTVSIFVSQHSLFERGFIKDFHDRIQALSFLTNVGHIRWVGLAEVHLICQNEFNSEPNQYPFTSNGCKWDLDPAEPDGDIDGSDLGRTKT